MRHTRARKLVEQVVSSGQDTSAVLDAMLREDLPDLPQIAHDIQGELKSRGVVCAVVPSRKGDSVVYIELHERSFAADAVVDIFEAAYPEIKILVACLPN